MTGSFGSLLSEVFESSSQWNTTGCFDYQAECSSRFIPCNKTHSYRYNDPSAAWVLISAIIVFFMKAGFMLIELAFAQNVREKKHVVVVKHLDVFASAFGFFWLGFHQIANYVTGVEDTKTTWRITDPILWFFKFTFASNAATIVGGCLVTNRYKLRLPAAFMSSFVISGIIHPLIARLIWSDNTDYFSVYRFCRYNHNDNGSSVCGNNLSLRERMYILDFAGGGAVHLVGGVAGLVLCLFAKLHKHMENKKLCYCWTDVEENGGNRNLVREERERISVRNFWEWMYPVDGGGETISEAALGVLILWFCWFAFNCGSTESIESILQSERDLSYHDVPSVIAINMIMAASSGGVVAVIIASWAQFHSQAESVNANEIANGVLSALVAITAGCPFVDYWAACMIGVIAVIIYHIGCWLEYKLGIEDTARVVPVHGLCGLWSLLAVGLFVFDDHQSSCNLHATFEGICFCFLRLPKLSQGERIAAQLLGAVLMILITFSISCALYGTLFFIPIKSRMKPGTKFGDRYNWCMLWLFKIVFKLDKVLNLEGNLLFTGPGEIPHLDYREEGNLELRNLLSRRRAHPRNGYQTVADDRPIPENGAGRQQQEARLDDGKENEIEVIVEGGPPVVRPRQRSDAGHSLQNRNRSQLRDDESFSGMYHTPCAAVHAIN